MQTGAVSNNNVGGGTGAYGGAQQQPPPASSTSPTPPQSMMMSPPQQQRINHQHQQQQQQQHQHQHLQHQLMMYKAQREREQQQQQLQTNNYQRQGNNNNYAQQPGYAPATQQQTQTQAQTQQQMQNPITTAIPHVQSYSPPPVSPVYGPLNSGIPLSGSDVHYQFLTAEKRLVPGVARAALNPSLPYLNLQPRLLSSSGTTLCHGLHGTIEFYSRDLSTHFSVQPTSSQLQGLAVSAFNMIAYSTQDGSLGIVQKYEPCRFTEILHPSPSKTVLSNLTWNNNKLGVATSSNIFVIDVDSLISQRKNSVDISQLPSLEIEKPATSLCLCGDHLACICADGKATLWNHKSNAKHSWCPWSSSTVAVFSSIVSIGDKKSIILASENEIQVWLSESDVAVPEKMQSITFDSKICSAATDISGQFLIIGFPDVATVFHLNTSQEKPQFDYATELSLEQPPLAITIAPAGSFNDPLIFYCSNNHCISAYYIPSHKLCIPLSEQIVPVAALEKLPEKPTGALEVTQTQQTETLADVLKSEGEPQKEVSTPLGDASDSTEQPDEPSPISEKGVLEALQHLEETVSRCQQNAYESIEQFWDTCQLNRESTLKVVESVEKRFQSQESRIRTFKKSLTETPTILRSAIQEETSISPFPAAISQAQDSASRKIYGSENPFFSKLKTTVEQTQYQQLSELLRKSVEDSLSKVVSSLSLVPAYERATEQMSSQIFSEFDSSISSVFKTYNTVLRNVYEFLPTKPAPSPLLGQTKELVDSLERDCNILFSSDRTEIMQNSLAVFQQYLCSNGAPSCENSILLEVNRDLLTNHYDHAFDLTLSQQDLELVVWLCSTIDITNGEAMVSERAAVLKSMTQPVLLSLLQQLAFDLSSHTLLKMSWLMQVIESMNPQEPCTMQYAPDILDKLAVSLADTRHPVAKSLLVAIQSLMSALRPVALTPTTGTTPTTTTSSTLITQAPPQQQHSQGISGIVLPTTNNIMPLQQATAPTQRF